MDDAAETPHDKPPEQKSGSAADLVTEAEGSGKLKALDDLMTEMGWPETSGTLLILAQKDERTRGKSPEELAEALRADPSLYDDLEAYKPGGKLEALAKGGEAETPEEDDGEPVAEMGEYVGKSGSFKDAEPKRAKRAMKEAGASRPSDLDDDYDVKRDFMSRMAE